MPCFLHRSGAVEQCNVMMKCGCHEVIRKQCLDLASPFLANLLNVDKRRCVPIFSQTINVLGLNFKVKLWYCHCCHCYKTALLRSINFWHAFENRHTIAKLSMLLDHHFQGQIMRITFFLSFCSCSKITELRNVNFHFRRQTFEILFWDFVQNGEA